MASVVIIHAAEDTLPARALAEKLRGASLTPVIETAPGEDLRAAMSTAALTLALWSPRSAAQRPLVDDASYASLHSKLVHACMQNTPVPAAFDGDVAIDLTGWRGEDNFPAWRELLAAVTQLAGVPLPPAPARGQASFFSPGRPPEADQRAAPAPQRAAPPPRPPAQAPAPRAAAPTPRPAPAAPLDESPKPSFPLAPILIAAVLVVGGVGGYFVWNGMQGAQTAAAWDDIPRNDADALRDFIAGNPGAHREDAEQALTELEEQSYDAAQEEDSIDGFERFLNEFPGSDYAIAARGRIAELRSMPAIEEATIEPPPIDTTTLADPDLLPPTSAEPMPDTTDSTGPAQLTPAEPDPVQGPAELGPPPG